jgi:uncharacterized membrane protein
MTTNKVKSFFSAKNIATLAVLTALVVVLQTALGSVKIGPTSFSVVLIPIVLGAILLGPWAGGFLGFVFGAIVLIYGISGADAFTNILFADHPFLTSLTCLLKGVAAGVVPALLFRLISEKNRYVAVFVAAGSAPIVNTGIFIVMALLMSDTLSANFVADGMSVIYFLVIGCAGVNFLVEFAVNLLLSPAIHTVYCVTERQIQNKREK